MRQCQHAANEKKAISQCIIPWGDLLLATSAAAAGCDDQPPLTFSSSTMGGESRGSKGGEKGGGTGGKANTHRRAGISSLAG